MVAIIEFMTEKIPAKFRKTKTDKWAVMAPVEDLERALTEGGKVDVLKKSGDWSTFRIASLGRPFEVDGVDMCYGYGPGDEDSDTGTDPAQAGSTRPGRRKSKPAAAPPSPDESEPMPEYQGGTEDGWGDEF